MKGFQRITTVLLVSVMMIELAACSSTQTEGTKVEVEGSSQTAEDTNESSDESSAVGSETNEETGQYTILTDSNGEKYDLGGMQIVIGDWSSSGEEEEPTNAYEEARREYIDWIQKTYNFTIKKQAISTWGDMPEDFVNFAASGGKENYVFTLRQGSELVSAMNSGLMYDLSTLDCLDFSKRKWRSGIHELLNKDGAVYGMRAINPQPGVGIYFNKRLLQEAGINPDVLYDYQENMEWTWDKYEELLKQVQKDTDNDGVIDSYAMTNFASTLYAYAVYSNGGEFIGKDENGKYYNDLDSNETMEALNWAVDLINKYEMVYPEDAEWDYTYTAFANGEAAFDCAEAYQAGGWNEMEDDFGFICFPMGPNATDYVTCHNDNVHVIPSCYDAERAWKIAFAYNLYTEPVPGYEDYAAWKASYYNDFKDTKSVDFTIARMMENGMVTYHTMIPGLSLGSDLTWNISKDSTPAQQADAIRNTWAAYLKEANK